MLEITVSEFIGDLIMVFFVGLTIGQGIAFHFAGKK
jgi:hypothetical protein